MFIESLYKLIKSRKAELPEGSYTASLFKAGLDKIIQKVGEEAVEVVIAAKNKNKKEQILELSDLWFSIIVLMVELNFSFKDLEAELKRRNMTKKEK